jgi:hypothetical protein
MNVFEPVSGSYNSVEFLQAVAAERHPPPGPSLYQATAQSNRDYRGARQERQASDPLGGITFNGRLGLT